MATPNEEPKQDKWEKYKDIFEGEDDDVVASAKVRHLAYLMRKKDEEPESKNKKKKFSLR